MKTDLLRQVAGIIAVCKCIIKISGDGVALNRSPSRTLSRLALVRLWDSSIVGYVTMVQSVADQRDFDFFAARPQVAPDAICSRPDLGN